ncbi:MAG: hypothetical protein KDC42_05985 [Ignavibacteriae bacterium]|nr:hypothetical protein [Ignavibacteriota bacterium]
MNKIISIIFLFVIALMVFGCESKPKDMFVNKVFVHEEGGQKQIVGFYDDKMIFKWDDTLGVEYHESQYNINPVNDSTFNIEVKDKTPYMESNTWQIVMSKDGVSFTSADSKKRYVLSQGE